MRNKKAAIELSVTAIVILILAIVMLGLGLGFIRGMFGKVTTTFEEQIAAEPEPPAPSGAEPMTLSRESIIVHAKDRGALKVAIYNPTAGTLTMQPGLTCVGAISTITSSSNSRAIPQGESRTYAVLYTLPDAAAEGTYLCKVSATSGTTTYDKDLTIRVKK